MLDLWLWFVSWRCALRYPLAPWLCSPRGSLGTESRRRLQVLHGLGPFLRLRYLRSLPLSPTGRGLPVPLLLAWLRRHWRHVCRGDYVLGHLLLLRCCVGLHVLLLLLLLLLLLRLLLLWFGWLCLVILLRLLRLLRWRLGRCDVSRGGRGRCSGGGGRGLRSARGPGGFEDRLRGGWSPRWR